MEIKISVGIPVYNTSQYLEECLTSVINQSLKEIEIIIINDGSTDNSLEILEKFQKKDSRIKIINQKNSGLSSVRNRIIKEAKGEYIQHIDSDDFIKDKDYLKDTYMFSKKYNLDIVVTDYFRQNQKKEILTINSKLNCLEEKILSSNIFLEEFFKGKESVALWNKLIKLSLYKENNIKATLGLDWGEDIKVLPELIYYSKKIGYINKAYYCYRVANNSISQSGKSKKHQELFKNLNLVYETFKNLKYKKLELVYTYCLTWSSSFIDMKYERNEYYKKNYESFMEWINNKYFFKQKKYIGKRKIILSLCRFVKNYCINIEILKFYRWIKKGKL